MARKKPKGWVKEPVRHGLAAKGIKTAHLKKRASQIEGIVYLIQGSKKEYGEPVYVREETKEDGGGMGSFLDPPNYPTHRFSIVSGYDRGGGFQSSLSIATFYKRSKSRGLTEIVKALEPVMAWNRLPESHSATQKWIEYVYAYMRNSYSPDGKNRNVSDAVSDGPPEHHLAYMFVRKFYPQHKPRKSLIKNPPQWGRGTTYPRHAGGT